MKKVGVEKEVMILEKCLLRNDYREMSLGSELLFLHEMLCYVSSILKKRNNNTLEKASKQPKDSIFNRMIKRFNTIVKHNHNLVQKSFRGLENLTPFFIFWSLGGCCITLLDHNSPFRELEARWICFSKPFKTDFWPDYKSLVGRTNADNPEEKQRTSP